MKGQTSQQDDYISFLTSCKRCGLSRESSTCKGFVSSNPGSWGPSIKSLPAHLRLGL